MLKIAPSLLSDDFAHLGRDVEAARTADYLHFDVMDGSFVPNLSFGIPVLQSVRKITSLPLDVHLMIEKPVRYIGAFAQAGADLILIETMTDLQEARAALLAAKENSSLPVIVTMTYEERGRTFLGCDPASAALTLEGMGADAIGVNCSLGPREMPPLVRELTRWSTLPIAIKPNAGLPDPGGAGYDITAEEFAGSMAELTGLGVKLYGGCCGTTPEYIALLREKLAGRTIVQVPRQVPAAVCSGTRTVPIDRVRVIGERINPTGKKLMKEALRRGDVDYMLNQALAQTEAGADILDVNVGLPEIDEAEMMVRTVKALQGVTDAPLQLDSTDPRVLEGALRVYCGKAIVNSVNGDEETLNAILPLVKKYGAAVVGLTLDHTGIPKTVDARLSVARRILDRALSYGIRREDVYIDCLTLTVSAEQEAAAQTLEGLRRVKGELGLKTVLGVSNISFGLPARPLINQNFLTMAMAAGLAQLTYLREHPEVYEHINAKGAALAEGLRQLVKRTGAPVVINQLGSLLAPFFTPTAVTTFTDAKGSDVAKYARYFQGMLERGVALAPAQFEAMFISEAHTQAELDATLAAAEAVFQTL